MEVPSPWGEEALEEDEEELEDAEGESSGKVALVGKAGSFLTKRGITLRVLLKDGLIEAGQGVLSIHYLGRKFQGDLLVDGKIRWQENGQAFNSPSAWATHCKKLVNPAKKSGCGWASVRYKGQKLDQYKTAWLRQNQPHGPPAEGSPMSDGEEEELPEEDEEEEARDGKMSNLDPSSGKKHQVTAQRCSQPEIRVPVRYATLGIRDSARDQHTLVEVTSFMAMNKFQPFHVSVSSNALLLVDFHSHLTRSEVVGYLGGRWDTNSQLLTVLRAFPCRSRLKDTETATVIEEEDVEAQMDYQLKLQGAENSFQPCLGLICGPYFQGNQGVQSTICPFWVIPPAEHRPNDYGIPMEVEVTYTQDSFLTNDILHEMMMLVEFYKGAPDLIPFQDVWSEERTYLDKLKGSLSSRIPKDQGFGPVLDQVYTLLKQLS